MSKSLIYTENTTVQALAAGATISLGNVIRRYGQNIKLNGNAINICGAGYYNVDANVTVTGTNEGTVTISLLKDNVEYTTRTATVAVGDIIVIPLNAVIREYGCCANNNSNITFVLGGVAESITDISIVVTKE